MKRIYLVHVYAAHSGEHRDIVAFSNYSAASQFVSKEIDPVYSLRFSIQIVKVYDNY